MLHLLFYWIIFWYKLWKLIYPVNIDYSDVPGPLVLPGLCPPDYFEHPMSPAGSSTFFGLPADSTVVLTIEHPVAIVVVPPVHIKTCKKVSNYPSSSVESHTVHRRRCFNDRNAFRHRVNYWKRIDCLLFLEIGAYCKLFYFIFTMRWWDT